MADDTQEIILIEILPDFRQKTKCRIPTLYCIMLCVETIKCTLSVLKYEL